MTEYRFYRSAAHPDFIRHEIEPKLVLHELPISLAPMIARLMDYAGWGLEQAIEAVNNALSADWRR